MDSPVHREGLWPGARYVPYEGTPARVAEGAFSPAEGEARGGYYIQCEQPAGINVIDEPKAVAVNLPKRTATLMAAIINSDLAARGSCQRDVRSLYEEAKG